MNKCIGFLHNLSIIVYILQETKSVSEETDNPKDSKNKQDEGYSSERTPGWDSISSRYRRLVADQVDREKSILKKGSLFSILSSIVLLPIIAISTATPVGMVSSLIVSVIWCFNAAVGYLNHREGERFLSLHFVGFLGLISLFVTSASLFSIQGIQSVPYAFFITLHSVPMTYLIGYTLSQIRSLEYS